MKILIVGASGLVGGNCLKYFRQRDEWEVAGTYYSYKAGDTVFFDTLDPTNPLNFDANAFAPDVVLHCGALTHVDYCEEHAGESHRKTVHSTLNIIELCRKHHARMVFVSTDYVFDGKEGPYAEEATVHPISVYGRHKLEAEELVRDNIADHIIIRVTNVYGDEERGKNFVARILSQVKEGKRLTLKLPGDQFATPINALDIARCLYLLIQDRKRGTFHIAGTDYMSRVQLWLRILHHFPEAEYDLDILSSEDLGQKADRPLQGGLKNKKFMQAYPDFSFSTIDDYLSAKKSQWG
jgi:dTDP-4-dehydrorhamnose reductase